LAGSFSLCTHFLLEELTAELCLPDGVSPDAALRDLRAQVDGFEVEGVREAVTALQSR